MPLDLWLTFVAASTLLLLIPGPTVLLVLSYALSRGRSVAVASAAGVATGDLIAISLSLAGLGAIVAASATLFTVLKWLGALYLIWLGIGLFRAAPQSGLLAAAGSGASTSVYRHTALVTALNPKSIAFFVAFVPQFVTPAAALLPQFAILTGTFVTLATSNALAYALAADWVRRTLVTPAILPWLTRLGGAALVTMGVVLATMRRST